MSDFFTTWMQTVYVEGDKFTPLVSQKNLLALTDIRELSDGQSAVDKSFTLSGSQNTADTYENSKLKVESGLEGAEGNHFAWLVPVGELNHVIEVPNKDVALTRSNKARANAFKLAVDQGTKQFGQDISQRFEGDSGGSLGSGTYATSGNVFTFTNPEDARHFTQGQLIEASADDGTGGGDVLLAQRASVVSVNVDAGTMVLGTASSSASAASPGAAWTNGLALFLWKAYNFDAGDLTSQILSASAVIPLVNPGDTLAGVNRAKDSRLAGVRISATEAGSLSIADRIIELCAKGTGIAGWMPGDRYAVMYPTVLSAMIRELQAQGYPIERESEARYGFRGVMLETDIGTVKCVSSRCAPRSVIRVLDMGGIKCWTANGKLVDFVRNPDGGISQLADERNKHRVRLVNYNATVWDNPAHHGIVASGL